jgi:hypothetical protein
MTEIEDREPARDDADWLVSDEPVSSTDAPTGLAAGGRRTAIAGVGLVLVGAVVGGAAITALRSHSTTSSSPSAFVGGAGGQLSQGQQLPGQPGQLPGQGLQGQGLQGQGGGGFAGGAPGGVDGEQRVAGTVTAVGQSTVSIHSSLGTKTYGVTSETEIVRNGTVAQLSAVRSGDSVFVHLIPGSGSSYVVERLFAQSGTGSGSTGAASGSSGRTT